MRLYRDKASIRPCNVSLWSVFSVGAHRVLLDMDQRDGRDERSLS